MKSSLLALTLLVAFAAQHSNAAVVLINPGTINATTIDIAGGNGANDADINNHAEAEVIRAAVNAQLGGEGSGVIGTVTAPGKIYNVTKNNAGLSDRIDFGGAGRDFNPTTPYPGGTDGTQFVISATGVFQLPAGDYTLHNESDDGFSFVLTDAFTGAPINFGTKFGSSQPQGAANEMRFNNPTGNSNTGAQLSLLNALNTIRFDYSFNERGGGDYGEMGISLGLNTLTNRAGYEAFADGALGGALVLAQDAILIPEPTTVTLGLIGLAGLLVRRRRAA